MKTKTPQKERAAAPTTALTTKDWSGSYQIAPPVSSLQSEIGTLLLCLQLPVGPELSQIGWQLFERLLRRYVGLRISQHGRQSVDTAPEATNSSQRVSG